jgi:hypothetical protein
VFADGKSGKYAKEQKGSDTNMIHERAGERRQMRYGSMDHGYWGNTKKWLFLPHIFCSSFLDIRF